MWGDPPSGDRPDRDRAPAAAQRVRRADGEGSVDGHRASVGARRSHPVRPAGAGSVVERRILSRRCAGRRAAVAGRKLGGRPRPARSEQPRERPRQATRCRNQSTTADKAGSTAALTDLPERQAAPTLLGGVEGAALRLIGGRLDGSSSPLIATARALSAVAGRPGQAAPSVQRSCRRRCGRC